jgi:hypothetical protein
MGGDGISLSGLGDVFAKVREDGSDGALLQGRGRGKRIRRRFSWHESGYGAAHEGIARGALSKPAALRTS